MPFYIFIYNEDLIIHELRNILLYWSGAIYSIIVLFNAYTLYHCRNDKNNFILIRKLNKNERN